MRSPKTSSAQMQKRYAPSGIADADAFGNSGFGTNEEQQQHHHHHHHQEISLETDNQQQHRTHHMREEDRKNQSYRSQATDGYFSDDVGGEQADSRAVAPANNHNNAAAHRRTFSSSNNNNKRHRKSSIHQPNTSGISSPVIYSPQEGGGGGGGVPLGRYGNREFDDCASEDATSTSSHSLSLRGAGAGSPHSGNATAAAASRNDAVLMSMSAGDARRQRRLQKQTSVVGISPVVRPPPFLNHPDTSTVESEAHSPPLSPGTGGGGVDQRARKGSQHPQPSVGFGANQDRSFRNLSESDKAQQHLNQSSSYGIHGPPLPAAVSTSINPVDSISFNAVSASPHLANNANSNAVGTLHALSSPTQNTNHNFGASRGGDGGGVGVGGGGVSASRRDSHAFGPLPSSSPSPHHHTASNHQSRRLTIASSAGAWQQHMMDTHQHHHPAAPSQHRHNSMSYATMMNYAGSGVGVPGGSVDASNAAVGSMSPPTVLTHMGTLTTNPQHFAAAGEGYGAQQQHPAAAAAGGVAGGGSGGVVPMLTRLNEVMARRRNAFIRRYYGATLNTYETGNCTVIELCGKPRSSDATEAEEMRNLANGGVDPLSGGAKRRMDGDDGVFRLVFGPDRGQLISSVVATCLGPGLVTGFLYRGIETAIPSALLILVWLFWALTVFFLMRTASSDPAIVQRRAYDVNVPDAVTVTVEVPDVKGSYRTASMMGAGWGVGTSGKERGVLVPMSAAMTRRGGGGSGGPTPAQQQQLSATFQQQVPTATPNRPTTAMSSSTLRGGRSGTFSRDLRQRSPSGVFTTANGQRFLNNSNNGRMLTAKEQLAEDESKKLDPLMILWPFNQILKWRHNREVAAALAVVGSREQQEGGGRVKDCTSSSNGFEPPHQQQRRGEDDAVDPQQACGDGSTCASSNRPQQQQQQQANATHLDPSSSPPSSLLVGGGVGGIKASTRILSSSGAQYKSYIPYVERDVRLRYCFICWVYRGPRTHHCRRCDNCVDIFDHHCPWTGTCIGAGNYRPFLWFLLSLNLLVLSILASCIAAPIRYSMEERIGMGEALVDLWCMPVVIFATAAGVGHSILSLFLYHMYIVSIGVTTLEHIRQTWLLPQKGDDPSAFEEEEGADDGSNSDDAAGNAATNGNDATTTQQRRKKKGGKAKKKNIWSRHSVAANCWSRWTGQNEHRTFTNNFKHALSEEVFKLDHPALSHIRNPWTRLASLHLDPDRAIEELSQYAHRLNNGDDDDDDEGSIPASSWGTSDAGGGGGMLNGPNASFMGGGGGGSASNLAIASVQSQRVNPTLIPKPRKSIHYAPSYYQQQQNGIVGGPEDSHSQNPIINASSPITDGRHAVNGDTHYTEVDRMLYDEDHFYPSHSQVRDRSQSWQQQAPQPHQHRNGPWQQEQMPLDVAALAAAADGGYANGGGGGEPIAGSNNRSRQYNVGSGPGNVMASSNNMRRNTSVSPSLALTATNTATSAAQQQRRAEQRRAALSTVARRSSGDGTNGAAFTNTKESYSVAVGGASSNDNSPNKTNANTTTNNNINNNAASVVAGSSGAGSLLQRVASTVMRPILRMPTIRNVMQGDEDVVTANDNDTDEAADAEHELAQGRMEVLYGSSSESISEGDVLFDEDEELVVMPAPADANAGREGGGGGKHSGSISGLKTEDRQAGTVFVGIDPSSPTRTRLPAAVRGDNSSTSLAGSPQLPSFGGTGGNFPTHYPHESKSSSCNVKRRQHAMTVNLNTTNPNALETTPHQTKEDIPLSNAALISEGEGEGGGGGGGGGDHPRIVPSVTAVLSPAASSSSASVLHMLPRPASEGAFRQSSSGRTASGAMLSNGGGEGVGGGGGGGGESIALGAAIPPIVGSTGRPSTKATLSSAPTSYAMLVPNTSLPPLVRGGGQILADPSESSMGQDCHVVASDSDQQNGNSVKHVQLHCSAASGSQGASPTGEAALSSLSKLHYLHPQRQHNGGIVIGFDSGGSTNSNSIIIRGEKKQRPSADADRLPPKGSIDANGGVRRRKSDGRAASLAAMAVLSGSGGRGAFSSADAAPEDAFYYDTNQHLFHGGDASASQKKSGDTAKQRGGTRKQHRYEGGGEDSDQGATAPAALSSKKPPEGI